MLQHKKKATIRYFGDYILMGEIAEGGMGVVFDARQISLNRRVALKLIRSGARASEGELRRFRVEAEAAARLDHPGIVPIYEVGEHDGQAFLAMKLIEGESLAEKLEARERSAEAAKIPKDPEGTLAIPSPSGVLDFEGDAARLIAQVARAVAHAHERGVFHRDIKPGNILIDAAGTPHLTDFGIAKLVENSAHQTLSHTLLGTPAYMSPEQAAGRREAISAASDIYSLGAVLHALLTGRPPPRPAGIDSPDGATPPGLPRSKAPDPAKDALHTICRRCLELDPQRRYPSALALAEDLERWLAGEVIQAKPPDFHFRLRRFIRRHSWITASAAILLVGSLIGIPIGLWLGHRNSPDRSRDSTLDRLAWRTVSTPSIQAEPNHGYRLRSRQNVSITLPASPVTGDVVRVVDSGSGWRLLPNSNQVVVAEELGVLAAARHWTKTDADHQWTSVASSEDGTKLAAVAFGIRDRGGQIWVSTNGGLNWGAVGPRRYWTSCAMSADGVTMAAAAAFGKLYLSTNSGQTWQSREVHRNWTGIACSADGRNLVAVDNGTNVEGGFIYISKDRGESWTPTENQRTWHFVDSSADGQVLAACVGEANVKGELAVGYLYVSRDGGSTWKACLTDAPRRWTGVAISGDGRVLCAIHDNGRVAPGGQFFVSLDGGETWNGRGPTQIWCRLGMAKSAGTLVAAVRTRPDEIQELSISHDRGETWRSMGLRVIWSDVAGSADGRRWIASAGHSKPGRENGLYQSIPTTQPGADGAITGAAGTEIELQYAGHGQFRITHARGRIEVDGTVISKIFPRRL
jgi:serine/threonine protein kinase